MCTASTRSSVMAKIYACRQGAAMLPVTRRYIPAVRAGNRVAARLLT
jgi:hypothetical protein